MAKKHNDNAFKRGLVQQQKSNALITATYKAHLTMALYTLHKDFGFGNKRLEKFIEEFNKTLECYNGDYVSYKDLAELLKDECGIGVQ